MTEPRVFWMPMPADPENPTIAELAAGTDLTPFIAAGADDGIHINRSDDGPTVISVGNIPVAKVRAGRGPIRTEDLVVTLNATDRWPRFVARHKVIDGEVVEPANRAERRAIERGKRHG